jgi:hypothetical protein
MKGLAMAVPLVFLVVTAGAGCGGTATKASPATISPTSDLRAQAAQAYQVAANAFNQTNNAVGATLASLPSTAPWSDTVAPAQESLTATEAFETAVRAIRFPTQDQADASALLAALGADVSDLQAIVADPSDATWTTYAGDNATSASDSDAIRNDLGLPPAPTS